MSSLQIAPEHVCYVHCNFCNTVLAVSVPMNNILAIVTVRCGHCSNLLSVNLRASLVQPAALHQDHHQACFMNNGMQYSCSIDGSSLDQCAGSSSSSKRMPALFSAQIDMEDLSMPIRPAEKRQRVPSAYNRFIKEEIRRIKANNPGISHREAFSTAAKNWAHFPHIHFGLTLDGTKQQMKLDEAAVVQNPRGFY